MKRRSLRKKKRSFLTRLILVFNIIFAGLLLFSYSASFIDPSTFWPISFIGLGYPWLLLTNVLLLIFWLFKAPKYALISALCIIAGYNFVLSTIGFRESAAIAVPKSSQSFIRVMTYNVHYFKKFDFQNDKIAKDLMMDVIRREQPDVLCIQEFWTRKKGEFHISKALRQILQSQHYYFQPSIDNNYEAVGLAIFSKYPIKKKGKVELKTSSGGNGAIFVDLQMDDKQFRIYNVHLQSINFQPQDYKYLKELTKEINTDVESSRRIGSLLKRAFIRRSEQAKQLKEHTENCKYPLVVAGDFNDTPTSFAVNTVAKGLKNSFREKGSGFGITYNGGFPNFQIDYILASSNFDVRSYRIIDRKISDHYAVRSDLELKN